MRSAALVAVLAACSDKAAPPADYFGKLPGPPGSLAKLAPGQPMTAARGAIGGQLSPTLDDRSRSVPDCVLADIPAPDGVTVTVTCAANIRPAVVGMVTVRVAHGGALASPDVAKTLAAAWGPPMTGARPFASWTGAQWLAEALVATGYDVVTFVPLATAETFGGAHKASLPDGLDGLRAGMNVADVERITSAKHGSGMLAAEHLPYRLVGADGRDGLTGLDFALVARDAAVIRSAWGKPDGAVAGARPSELWLDADAGWRADLVSVAPPALEYRVYAPLASALAAAHELLGNTPLELEVKHLHDGKRVVRATEFSTLGSLEAHGAPVTSVDLVLPYADAAGATGIAAALDAQKLTGTDDGHAWHVTVR